MYKVIIGAVVLIGAAIGTKAFMQSRMTQEEKVEHITEKMAKKLSLTDEQKKEVYAINLKRAEGHEEAYNQGRKKEVIVEAVKNWETELKGVLTVEQQQKLRLK